MSKETQNLVKTSSEEDQNKNIQNYYKLQSKIYDATRWTFLFGRKKLVRVLPFNKNDEVNILEIGCGTGYNLKRLARTYPNAKITGLDVSEDMINLSAKQTKTYKDRVNLLQQPYGPNQPPMPEKYDAIIFSYSLTMINPHWEDLIRHAQKDLKEGGVVGLADFHDSRFLWFKKHMSNHHVRMDGHLLALMKEIYEPSLEEVKPAYGGIWHYIVFIGKKK